jgi:hypothetical protein
VLIHASESAVKQHPAYAAAKSGHGAAAMALVADTMNPAQNAALQRLIGAGRRPVLVSAHAYEREGVNAIPAIFPLAKCNMLTGKPHSAKLAPSPQRLQELRATHGPELEAWWLERFAHGFDALTESEARFLARSPSIDTIRDRLAASQQA